MRLEGLRAKVRMMLDIEREALENLKHGGEWTSKKLAVSEKGLSGEKNG